MTSRKFEIKATKTYASEKNVDKAVADRGFSDLRHFIMRTEDGRFFPVFVGCDEPMQRGVHWFFNVVG